MQTLFTSQLHTHTDLKFNDIALFGALVGWVIFDPWNVKVFDYQKSPKVTQTLCNSQLQTHTDLKFNDVALFGSLTGWVIFDPWIMKAFDLQKKFKGHTYSL